jgi:hypothetical protein
MEKKLFSEEQRFDQLWLKVPLYVLAVGNVALFAYGFYKQLIAGKPWGDNPMSDVALAFTTFAVFLIWGLVFFLFEKTKLITAIYKKEIRLRFPPFFYKEKTIPIKLIQKMEVRKYNPITEYGGWGLRYGLRGKAYNVKGNMGLQIQFINGKKLLIGTQKPDQAKWAITKIIEGEKSINRVE